MEQQKSSTRGTLQHTLAGKASINRNHRYSMPLPAFTAAAYSSTTPKRPGTKTSNYQLETTAKTCQLETTAKTCQLEKQQKQHANCTSLEKSHSAHRTLPKAPSLHNCCLLTHNKVESTVTPSEHTDTDVSLL
jgi:hypothetical protein